MKAQIINQFGDPSVFQMLDLPIPQLKARHVLIKVHATSVNPIDCKIRSGAVSDIAPPFPAVLHGDVAGTIEVVGKNVNHYKKGDEIFGCAGGVGLLGGALAEYMLADTRLISKKPVSLSMQKAAALPLVSITAWLALFEKLKLKKGMNILIYGGTGGVGHVAIQLAKWCGATVYTTVRNSKDIARLKALGADEVINVREETVEEYTKRLTENRGFERIFDTVGNKNLEHSFAASASNGVVVTIAARTTCDLTVMHNKGLSLQCVLMLLPLLNNKGRENYGKILRHVSQIVDEGKLKPLIDPHPFQLENIANAHALIESGNAKGKVVISLND